MDSILKMLGEWVSSQTVRINLLLLISVTNVITMILSRNIDDKSHPLKILNSWALGFLLLVCAIDIINHKHNKVENKVADAIVLIFVGIVGFANVFFSLR